MSIKEFSIFVKKQLTILSYCDIIVDALGICVKVAQQTLTLYVWVRILDPQPEKNDKFRLVVFSIKSAFCGINPPVVDEIALR